MGLADFVFKKVVAALLRGPEKSDGKNGASQKRLYTYHFPTIIVCSRPAPTLTMPICAPVRSDNAFK